MAGREGGGGVDVEGEEGGRSGFGVCERGEDEEGYESNMESKEEGWRKGIGPDGWADGGVEMGWEEAYGKIFS